MDILKNFYVVYSASALVTLLGMVISVACGAFVAGTYFWAKREKVSKNFMIALILMPLVAQGVVLMVNRYGTIGTGVAVAGAFAMIQFRSIPASPRDIVFVFMSMAVGVSTGSGVFYFGMALTAMYVLVYVLANLIVSDKLLAKKHKDLELSRELRITVPDDLDYRSEFVEILQKHTKSNMLVRVKSQNMGSLFVLTYKIELNSEDTEKPLIDELRVVNRNLPIVSILNELSREYGDL